MRILTPSRQTAKIDSAKIVKFSQNRLNFEVFAEIQPKDFFSKPWRLGNLAPWR